VPTGRLMSCFVSEIGPHHAISCRAVVLLANQLVSKMLANAECLNIYRRRHDAAATAQLDKQRYPRMGCHFLGEAARQVDVEGVGQWSAHGCTSLCLRCGVCTCGVRPVKLDSRIRDPT
jgi:hypothetical protein